MKKHLSLALAFILCLGLLLSLSACNSDFNDTYYLYNEGNYFKEQYYTLKNGKWSSYQDMQGRYEIDGQKITFYAESNGVEGVLITGSIKEGELVLHFGDYPMVFRTEQSN